MEWKIKATFEDISDKIINNNRKAMPELPSSYTIFLFPCSYKPEMLNLVQLRVGRGHFQKSSGGVPMLMLSPNLPS